VVGGVVAGGAGALAERGPEAGGLAADAPGESRPLPRAAVASLVVRPEAARPLIGRAVPQAAPVGPLRRMVGPPAAFEPALRVSTSRPRSPVGAFGISR